MNSRTGADKRASARYSVASKIVAQVCQRYILSDCCSWQSNWSR